MNEIEKQFEFLGLLNSSKYEDAQTFSKHYKKCSILTHNNITYSSTTEQHLQVDNQTSVELSIDKV